MPFTCLDVAGFTPGRKVSQGVGLFGACFFHVLRSHSKTSSDGEFGWGGTSVKRQRRCPKISSVRTEISRRTEG